MAVLDLAVVVDGSEPAGVDHDIAIIVAVGGTDRHEVVGLAVNDAVTVLNISEDAVSRSGGGFVVGEAVVDDSVIRILDPSALGSPAA